MPRLLIYYHSLITVIKFEPNLNLHSPIGKQFDFPIRIIDEKKLSGQNGVLAIDETMTKTAFQDF